MWLITGSTGSYNLFSYPKGFILVLGAPGIYSIYLFWKKKQFLQIFF